MKKSAILLSLLLSVYNLVHSQDTLQKHSLSGFTISITPSVMENASNILAHNEYAGADVFPDIYKINSSNKNNPVVKLPDGTTWKGENNLGFLWAQVFGREFSDSYLNEYGVAIVSQHTPARKELIEDKQAGQAGFWMLYLAAKEAMTAREAINNIGKWTAQYGLSSDGETIIISDLYESWVMCLLPGKHWAAQRIPDGNISVITGFYPITEINFSQNDDFLLSEGLEQYAIDKGLYHPEVNTFNFRKIFSHPQSLSSKDNKKRILNIINKFTASTLKEEDEIPFYMKPTKKISLMSIKNILRSHGININNGTDKHNEDNYPVCSADNTYSVVMEMRNWMPKELSSIMWFSPLKPCMQPYVPLYANINNIPGNFHRTRAIEAYDKHNENKGLSAGKKNMFFSLYLMGKKWETDKTTLASRLVFIRDKEKNFIEQIRKKEGKIMDMYRRGQIINSLKKDITSFNLKLLTGAYK